MGALMTKTLLTQTLASAALFLALPSLAQQERATVEGHVWFESEPLCTLVLANGQSTYSCNPNGPFDLDNVPLNPAGEINVQVFASGFAPYREAYTPSGSPPNLNLSQVDLERVENGRPLQVDATYEPTARDGWFNVTGTVQISGTPVCALVLANGQDMFSCNQSFGQFSLEVPQDAQGNITLQVFAAGFEPYKNAELAEPDSDGDGIPDRFDDDDDNDGIPDHSDPCPRSLGTDEVCEPVTAIVRAAGKEWAQPSIFTGLSWNEIYAACGQGNCTGTFNGYGMNGWTWATHRDMSDLFNTYQPFPPLGYIPQENLIYYSRDWYQPAADLWRQAGWQQTPYRHMKNIEELGGYQRTTSGLMKSGPSGGCWAGMTESIYLGSGYFYGSVTVGISCQPEDNEHGHGAWFYRN